MQGASREVVVESTGLSHSTIYRAIRNQRAHGEYRGSTQETRLKTKDFSTYYRHTLSFIFNNCLLYQIAE